MINGIESLNSLQYTYLSASKNVETLKENFDDYKHEDEAIISAKAKLLNELEKYNAGESDEISLALTSSETELTVAANVKVFETKDEMMETLLDMME